MRRRDRIPPEVPAPRFQGVIRLHRIFRQGRSIFQRENPQEDQGPRDEA
ncbi:hypothetical protein WDW86_05860 [Bdellovibrionota bacterium FG-2]